jgi:hypothetical protein
MQIQLRNIERCKTAIERIRCDAPRFERTLIETCTFWMHPRSKKWVAAPGHADRIDSAKYGRQVTFGSNSFLVELCVKRAFTCILEFLNSSDHSESGFKGLEARINGQISGSVSNFKGEEFPGLYPISGDVLKFGTTGIYVGGARNYILSAIGVRDVVIK